MESWAAHRISELDAELSITRSELATALAMVADARQEVHQSKLALEAVCQGRRLCRRGLSVWPSGPSILP